ncbi:YjcZ family sporulation protein [Bacillus sp. FJAT-45350]|uniref:YjcZ family sporulation protein n=1 Tax=Bacillus sp. FJAT-45350 TaxID=2011014 RepID=UPI000BB8AD45|nr:YjcZ family sporulation protein [Bacillus sp. FJAT-45350]
MYDCYGYGAMPVTGVQPGCAHTQVAGAYAPAAPVAGRGFALIVVLFILLIIIGASWATPAPKKPC